MTATAAYCADVDFFCSCHTPVSDLSGFKSLNKNSTKTLA